MISNPRPRWLIIAHAFNMDGRAASQTITDKLPHLHNAGIEIVVLSGVSGRQDTQVEHHQLWPMGPAGIKFELRHAQAMGAWFCVSRVHVTGVHFFATVDADRKTDSTS